MADAQGSNGSNTARWQLIVSAAAVIIAIGGALLSLYLTIGTLNNATSDLTIKVASLDEVMFEPRAREGGFATEIPAIRRNLVEIETQFCAEDAARSLRHANDLRNFAVVWAKVMGGKLPIEDAYYPHIGRCGAPVR